MNLILMIQLVIINLTFQKFLRYMKIALLQTLNKTII